MDAAPELDPRYYLKNFELLCDTVQRQYEDLLLEGELDFLHGFRQLSEPARCLYVRLVSRVGPLFRPEKLNYPELGELPPHLMELADSGFVLRRADPEPAEIARLCLKSELLEVFGARLERADGAKKADIIEQLLALELTPQACAKLWNEWYGEVLVEPARIEVVEVLLLLFFGNRHQSLTDFVLTELGVARYHDYPLDRGFRLFSTRAQIEEYLQFSELRRRYAEALDAGLPEQVCALTDELSAPYDSPALRHRCDRFRNRVARQLERYGEWEKALKLYDCSALHPARERRVRILQSLGREREALRLCQEMERQPSSEAELDFIARQIPQLQKKLGEDHQPPARLTYPLHRLELERGESGVELAAAHHYLERWPRVHFVENSLLNTLFGLALWEEIFIPLPGAFVNPFQSAPLDMHTADFYRRRREPLERKLAYLAGSDVRETLLENYDRYNGVSNHWVNWRAVQRELVETALATIPREHLLVLWRRILFDPQANRSGLPDLLALDPGRDYCLIEVKGPGDQLQNNQKRWLRFFQREQIPCMVARVEWRDA